MFGLEKGRLAGEWTKGSLQKSINNRLSAEQQVLGQQNLAQQMMEQEQQMRKAQGLTPLPSDLSASDWLSAQKPQKSLLGKVADVAMFPINNPIGQMALFMGAPYAIDALSPKPDPMQQVRGYQNPGADDVSREQAAYLQAMQAGGMAR